MHRVFAQTGLGELIRLQHVVRSYLIVTATLAALVAVPAAWGQATWYVDDDAPLGGNGASWTTAFKYLQDALALAEAGDEIHVAGGVYQPDQDEAGNVTPGDREATFELISGVGLYGGYAGLGAEDPDQRDVVQFETILSGDLNGDDGPDFANYDENSFHVAYGDFLDADTALDGFVLTGGNADGSGLWANEGGGLRVRGGLAQIGNCAFRYNQAEYGGAIVSEAWTSIIQCRFSGNRADLDGGAIVALLAPLRLVDCVFDRNVLLGTQGQCGGGAIDALAGAIDATNCAFLGNSAANHGGAIRSLLSPTTLTNCAFSGNDAGEGGALWTHYSNVTITNCVFSANSALESCGGIRVNRLQTDIVNSVLWHNSDADGTGESAQLIQTGVDGSISVSYSCIQNYTGTYGETGVITDDPLFVDANGADDVIGTPDDDLRLSPGSPSIDAGNNDAVPWDLDDLDGDGVLVEPVPFDLAGNPRFLDDPDTPDSGAGVPPIVDMGAFELLVPGLVTSVSSLPVPEGGTATFTVSLATAPEEPVTVTVTPIAGDPDITVESGSSLSFDGGNFDVPQPVTLAAALDEDDVNGETTIEVAGPGFVPVHVLATEADAEGGAAVILVNAAAAPDGDGTSWDTAFNDLQDGLEASDAIVAGVEIWVATGTYTPDRWTGDPEASFELRDNVALFGGFAGNEVELEQRDPLANPTILSGNLGTGQYSYHVVTATGIGHTAVVDGLTIRDGRAQDASTGRNGGGVSISNANPILRNCTFVNNEASVGGATCSELFSDPMFVACTFVQNTAESFGGAVYTGLGRATFVNCVFVGNLGVDGGAVRCSEGECWLTNCRFLGNTAIDDGGAVNAVRCEMYMMNCVFSGNDGEGAVHLGDGWVSIVNCAFSRNSEHGLLIVAPWIGAQAAVHNSIFWANGNHSENGQIGLEGSAQIELDLNYSCVQGWTGQLGGIGNHGENPLFVDTNGEDGVVGTLDDDLHLSAGSPCIDVGSNWLVLPDFADLDGDGDTDEPTPLDLDGEDRFVDDPNTPDGGGGVIAIVDMGAYEFGDSGPQYCMGDLTGDGSSDFHDLAVLLGHYGIAEGAQPCEGDIDNDGDIDIADLAWLLGVFGDVCE